MAKTSTHSLWQLSLIVAQCGSTDSDSLPSRSGEVRMHICIVVPSSDSEVHTRLDGPVQRLQPRDILAMGSVASSFW